MIIACCPKSRENHGRAYRRKLCYKPLQMRDFDGALPKEAWLLNVISVCGVSECCILVFLY